jgi:very-short-patch-repair endonuclease
MSDKQSRVRTPKTGKLWGKLKPVARVMRHKPTEAEDVLWQRLRRDQIAGFHFRRQHAIDRYVVDFYCAQARLIIEVDGSIHAESVEQDAARQEFLENLGFRMIRFTNDQVLTDIDDVVEQIRKFVMEG